MKKVAQLMMISIVSVKFHLIQCLDIRHQRRYTQNQQKFISNKSILNQILNHHNNKVHG
jgi:cytidylate kinase